MSKESVDAMATATPLSPAAQALIERRTTLSERSVNRIPKYANPASHPLSFGQQLIWLATKLDKTTAPYNRLSVVRITGRLDHGVLQRALSTIVARHEALRSRIVTEDGTPRAHTLVAETVPLPVTDVSGLSIDARPARVQELLDEEARKSFDLETGPWLRAGILEEGDDTSILYITTHHIASDGWSDGVMLSELQSLYRAYLAGKPSPLPDLTTQYRDFAAWQRERGDGAEGRRNAEYWQNYLAGAPRQELPSDHARPEMMSNAGGQVTRTVRSELVKSLEEIGRSEGATPAMTSLAAFMLWQTRITGQSDTVVGLSLAGRTHPEVEGLIGVFSSVLPLRVPLNRELTFRELLRKVRTAVLQAHEHQLVSVESIFEALPSAQGARHREIAQTLFNYRNMPAFTPSLPGLVVDAVETFNGSCLVDLDLEVVERSDGWKCDLRFRRDLYEDPTASRLLGHYLTLLESIASNPDEVLEHIQLLTSSERAKILVEFNGPVRALPAVLRLEEMFRQQARKTPQAIAVSSHTGELTYDELERQSNAAARDFRARGVGPGKFVGVCMERSVELMVSLMAVLKCGGAFVPLDPEYPSARLSHMIADTNPVLVLVDPTGLSLLGADDAGILLIDRAYFEALSPTESPPPCDDDDARAVACVLYTSGSTGLPKGVLSTHRGIANNLLAMQELFALTSNDCMLQHTSLGFDAAAWEIFWPLSVGARTYLARADGASDAEYLIDVMKSQAIGTICFGPSMLNVLLDVPSFTACARLRSMICVGEVLSPAVEQKFFARMPHVELYNFYGPSETSITVTGWRCERGDTRRTVPIGRPTTNSEVYILDAAGQPVPIGVAGELYVGGVSVSNGYHNRPELTAERFPPHPFRPDSGDRVYRSGDIARWGPDGVIEFVGRRDHQLKIRGVRVELEEIEAALNRLPGVRASVVVARADTQGDQSLVAYVATDAPDSTLELHRALENELPAQFLPGLIIPLKKLPLGPNGKVDRASLPDPSSFAQLSSIARELPSSGLEQRLASIWKDLLAVNDVGVHDSFFNLGGHSLLAVRMIQHVADELGQSISLRTFYAEPTIRALATLLSRETPNEVVTNRWPILRVNEGTAWPPLFYFNGQPRSGGRYVHKLHPYLPGDQGFYIVPLPIFDAPITVEGIAAEVIELIRAERPKGPYLLGGNCFGATLALEIAQQLQASGESVPLVVLIHPDALAPIQPWYRTMRRLALMSGVPEEFHYAEFSSGLNHTLRTAREIWRAQRKLSARERLDHARRGGQWLAGYVTRNTRKSRASSSGGTQGNNGMRDARLPMPDEIDSDDQTADKELAAHRHYVEQGWVGYTLRPYTGKVAIVWPLNGPTNPPWDPQALWKHFTPNFDWRNVPGNHWSMLHEYFEHSARALGDFIEQGRRR